MSEFEKVAIPIGQMLARGARAVWSPGSSLVARRTGQAATRRAAREALLQTARKTGVSQARAAGKAGIQEAAKRVQVARGAMTKLKQPGVIERVVGGRFGTTARRQARVRSATGSLG